MKIGLPTFSEPTSIVVTTESTNSIKLALIGTMSDGSPAPLSLLNSAIWTVEDPTICSIYNGIVVPLQSGTTKVYADIGGIKTSFDVMVDVVADTTKLTLSRGSTIEVNF